MGHGKKKFPGRAWRPLAALMLALLASLGLPTVAFASFGFESFRSTFEEGGVGDALLAGSHPESWTTTFVLNSSGPPGDRHPEGDLKDVHFELPPGLIADPGVFPTCPHAQFLAEECAASTAVG